MSNTNGDQDSLMKIDSPTLKLLSKQKISDDYILQSAVNNRAQAQVAVALSSNKILHFDTINKASTLTIENSKSLTGLKFSKETPTVLLSSSLDGYIQVWDTRSGEVPVQAFYDNTDLKPLLCFDFNVNEKFICAGTDLFREESFLLFWDRRSTKLLGGYWNSHTDEISQVQFHQSNEGDMASSSIDGLINIFNTEESSEDDALVNTLNTEISVNRFSWRNDGHVSCITGTEEYQFWSTEKTSPTMTMTREDFSNLSESRVDYLIDTFTVGKRSYVASGANDGSLQLYSHKKKLKFLGSSGKGHTDVIRTISPIQDRFLTGGEDGELCTWKLS